MARKKRTISMRALSRKDAQARSNIEAQARVIGAIQAAGFETVYPNKRQSNRVILKSAAREIMIVVWPVVSDMHAEMWFERRWKLEHPTDEFWVVGMDVTSDLYATRERYSPELKIMNIAEFNAALRDLQRAGRSRAPATRGTTAARTRVGKALLANADQLQTAVTTSLLLIENRIEVLNNERPNSDQSIAQRDNEIKALTEMKGSARNNSRRSR